jgi:hypothetical protein
MVRWASGPNQFEDTGRAVRLGQLERAVKKGDAWSRDDQEWLIGELRKAWEELKEVASPVDPSKIG